MKKLNEWLRWQIALLLNRYPDTCWADLVCWAVYPEDHPFIQVLSGFRDSAGQCQANGETPYCGKCKEIAEVGISHPWGLKPADIVIQEER